jgi:UDP-3-O-[3-hydroxymyristoyl] glucosamine N-acyltransferase
MADPRFFAVAGPFPLSRLREIAEAEYGGEVDPDAQYSDVAPLESASRKDISFLDNRRYLESFVRSEAGACVVHPSLAERAPRGMALLLSPEPYRAYARIARAFYPDSVPASGVADGAVVHGTARLGEDCTVESGAVVGPGAEVGRGCRIGANAVIGPNVVLGDDCRVGPCASLLFCRVGDRVIIHPGARIGQDGFGFAPGSEGHVKVPQLGRVIIEDDVEIGANTTIDRGAGPDTVIGAGTKIDNLVQIAHNVQLGSGCIIVSQVGISGSTKVGQFVMMGGQAGLTGHLRIGSGARIGAQSGVMRDVAPGATIMGSPAQPVREYWRQVAVVCGLAKKRKGN